MGFDVIVLGATFLGAGIAEALGDRCLMIDRRPQAGYEFINSLKFGHRFDKPLKTEAARSLLEDFKQNGAFEGDRICLFECAPHFYSLLLDKNVLLNTEIISVEHNDDGFTVTTHGVSGYRVHKAKTVIDTRSLPDAATEKYLNFIVNTDKGATLPDRLDTEKFGYECDTVVKCKVDMSDGYMTARKKVFDIVTTLEGFKVAMVADEFEYTIKNEIPKSETGITLFPSQSYANPLLAFDAGVIMGGEL